MANDRASLSIILPRGAAVFPKLNKPDYKFEKAGSYETKVRLDPEAADGLIGKQDATLSEILDQLGDMRDTFLAEKKAELAASKDPKAKAKSRTITAKDIGEPALDDEGEPTGELILKAKMKASGISAKDGKPWTRTPTLFDAKGKPMKIDGKPIYGGSVIKVAAKAVPYYMAAENHVGIALYLEAVQVIDLVSGGGRSANAFGFGAEDGYSAEDEAEADGRSQFNDESGDDAAAGDDEF